MLASDNDAIASFAIAGDPDGFFAIDAQWCRHADRRRRRGRRQRLRDRSEQLFPSRVTVENDSGLSASEKPVNRHGERRRRRGRRRLRRGRQRQQLAGDLSAGQWQRLRPRPMPVIPAAVNGTPFLPGQTITLPSGALLTVNAGFHLQLRSQRRVRHAGIRRHGRRYLHLHCFPQCRGARPLHARWEQRLPHQRDRRI